MLKEVGFEWFGMKLLVRNICNHNQTFAQDNNQAISLTCHKQNIVKVNNQATITKG